LLLGCGKEPRPEPAPRKIAASAAPQPEPLAPPPPTFSPPATAAIPVEPLPAPAPPPVVEKPEPPDPPKKETRKKHTAAPAPKRGGSTLQRDIFVRDAPGKDRGQVVLSLRAGTKVTRLAHKGQWVQISFEDPKDHSKKTGWIWQEAFANQDSRTH
jgi:hypothetical protein